MTSGCHTSESKKSFVRLFGFTFFVPPSLFLPVEVTRRKPLCEFLGMGYDISHFSFTFISTLPSGSEGTRMSTTVIQSV